MILSFFKANFDISTRTLSCILGELYYVAALHSITCIIVYGKPQKFADL